MRGIINVRSKLYIFMNNERNYTGYWIGGIIIVLLIIGGIFWYRSSNSYDNETETNATSTPTNTIQSVLPYGETTIGIGDQAAFAGISIRPTAVIEDSRCPADVQCIQAGTVKVNVAVELDNGARRQETVTLGETTSVGGFAVTLKKVTPQKPRTGTVKASDYEFTFEVFSGTPAGNNDLEAKG